MKTKNNLNLIVLASDNFVARFYLQLLFHKELFPEVIIVLKAHQTFSIKKIYSSLLKHISAMFWPQKYAWRNEFINQVKPLYKEKFSFQPNLDEPISKTLKKFRVKIYELNASCNEEKVVEIVRSLKSSYVLFCADCILNEILDIIDKEFIHIHPGYLPNLRGSDCMLYGALLEKKIGVTAFLMTKKIDSGKILLRKKFKILRFVFSRPYNDFYEFRYHLVKYVDTYYRALILAELLEMLISRNQNLLEFMMPEDKEIGRFYYYMYPKLIDIACKRFLLNEKLFE